VPINKWQSEEPIVFYMRKSLKYWLLGSICVILINFAFFLFRNTVDQILLLWVVILTPAALLALYPLTRLLDKDRPSRNENDS
jgi:hypothetical protein